MKTLLYTLSITLLAHTLAFAQSKTPPAREVYEFTAACDPIQHDLLISRFRAFTAANRDPFAKDTVVETMSGATKATNLMQFTTASAHTENSMRGNIGVRSNSNFKAYYSATISFTDTSYTVRLYDIYLQNMSEIHQQAAVQTRYANEESRRRNGIPDRKNPQEARIQNIDAKFADDDWTEKKPLSAYLKYITTTPYATHIEVSLRDLHTLMIEKLNALRLEQ